MWTPRFSASGSGCNRGRRSGAWRAPPINSSKINARQHLSSDIVFFDWSWSSWLRKSLMPSSQIFVCPMPHQAPMASSRNTSLTSENWVSFAAWTIALLNVRSRQFRRKMLAKNCVEGLVFASSTAAVASFKRFSTYTRRAGS